MTPKLITFCFDFDDTITAAPVVLAEIIRTVSLAGHNVVICTARPCTYGNKREIDEWLKKHGLLLHVSEFFFTDGKPKEAYVRKVSPDLGHLIWVDDQPASIVSLNIRPSGLLVPGEAKDEGGEGT